MWRIDLTLCCPCVFCRSVPLFVAILLSDLDWCVGRVDDFAPPRTVWGDNFIFELFFPGVCQGRWTRADEGILDARVYLALCRVPVTKVSWYVCRGFPTFCRGVGL